ncbi:MAG: hypothetical protein DHS20C16_34910 [Phycisphaerae bacterium]|nr:MAG: hypothetical protein DHS20C16_34910 [Phycisphaerae bacterium]
MKVPETTKFLICHGLCLAFAMTALGVEFNLVDPALEQQDDGSSMSLNVGGVDAILSTNIGTLNVNGEEFGIASSEDLEGQGWIVNGSEELSITFYEDVRWDAFYVWDQHENGCSVIATDSVGGDLFCGPGLKMSHGGVVIPAGDPIRLFASDSEGFSLATFAVTPASDGGETSDGTDTGNGDDGPTDNSEGTQDEVEPGSGNPIVRIELSGSGGGTAWFEYFDNASERSIYLGNFDTEEGTTSVESEVPLNEGIYVYTSSDECSSDSGLYYADGSPVSLGEDGRYGPIPIDEDTTLSARFVPNYLLCGSCSASVVMYSMMGMGLIRFRRRSVRKSSV